jgi:molecular chaperone GrpE
MNDTQQDHPELETDSAASDETIELSEAAAKVVEDLKAELDEAIAARKRALADFVNYQRRAQENEARIAHSAAARVVRAMLPVVDDIDRALDARSASTDQVLHGVHLVREQFMRVLAQQGVVSIEPKPGDEFDPMRHEAMLRQPPLEGAAIAPNHIVALLQRGYALHDTVLRPAKVAIAPE